jgi:hypothetical protein
MERGGREAGGQAAAGGASSKRRLLEGEATRRPFDEGEMKRRGRHVCSLTRVAGVGIGGGAWLEVEDGSGGPELGHKG